MRISETRWKKSWFVFVFVWFCFIIWVLKSPRGDFNSGTLSGKPRSEADQRQVKMPVLFSLSKRNDVQ